MCGPRQPIDLTVSEQLRYNITIVDRPAQKSACSCSRVTDHRCTAKISRYNCADHHSGAALLDCMTSPVRRLSSLVSLPKILSDSLVTALAHGQTDPDSLAYRLVPRPVYPIKLAIAAEGLAMVSKYALQYIQILLQVELVDKICCRLLILVRHSARSIYSMMRHACVIVILISPCQNTCFTCHRVVQVGSEILWTDVLSQECKCTSPIFSTHEHPIWYDHC